MTTNLLTEPHFAPQYRGPYKDIVKLLLSHSSSTTDLERIATNFLSSQRNASQDYYDFTSGIMLFYMLHYTSFMKIGSKDAGKKAKIEWVRTLIQVFLKQEFLGTICLGGLLKGYQMVKPQSKRHIIGDLIAEVEDALLASIDAQIDFIKGDQSLDLVEIIGQYQEDSKKEIITYICGQCFSSIPPSQMAKLNSKGIVLRIIIQVVFGGPQVFQNGMFISHVINDMRNNEGSLTKKWTKSTPSYKLLQAKCSGILFKEQPKISLGMAKLIQVVEKEDISILLSNIYFFAYLLFTWWELCPLNLIGKEEYLDNETKEAIPILWQIFRQCIFSVTMIFIHIIDRSYLEPEIYGEQERILIINTYSYLYFISSRFALYGFPGHKRVFFSVLDRVLDDESEPKIVIKICRPSFGNTPTQRSRITYYLLLIESLMRALDDDTVEQNVLPFIYPYLKDNSDIHLFESAHSAMLAIFSNMKRVANELAPFYCSLLLESYPTLIHVSQLRIAYTTIIKSLSNTDNAITFLCLEKLIKKIEDTPLSASSDTDKSKKILPTKSSSYGPQNENTLKTSDKEDNEIQSIASRLNRGHLLLTLIDQIQSVNLILLETLLIKIKYFLQAEQEGIGKHAIKKALFNALSAGLDYTKKDTGVKWWLSEGPKL
ncbi:1997_t:CDS:2 [Dentiscutata erythropus]|uniref:1997_t:CDS:1 n=1 Tax=Dentiscutata erythropus TaxID=1348616 RepID=A0A9N8YTB4_9GLOM|nr:1997_t:CDS:2 [Dentiscutata erythropus]